MKIIIPFYEGHEFIEATIASIPKDQEIIIIDDLSRTPPAINRPNVTIKRMDKKGYFSGAVNEGIKMTGEDVLILNQDCQLAGDAWKDFISESSSADNIAIAGDGVFGHPGWEKGYVQGTFMWMSRKAINRIGLLNEKDYPLWGATCEWQLRACRAGFNARPGTVPGFKHNRTDEFGYGIKIILKAEPDKKNLFIRTPPMLSVVIPCFNHGRFLADAISSLTEQTFKSTEIIIVDDGSTDDSANIAAELANPWKAIRFISQKNAGTPAAVNSGVKAAIAPYITILEADDMRTPESIERMYQEQIKNPHSIIYDDVFIWIDGEEKQIWRMPDYNFDELLEKNFIHAGIMFPKSGWKEIGGYPTEMKFGRQDWAANIAFGIAGYCGVHIPEPGYIYRRHGKNRTIKNTTKRWHKFFKEQIQALFPQVYKGERPMACCGGRTNGKVKPIALATGRSAVPAPQEGTLTVEYLGRNFGNQTIYGNVTGKAYRFSASKKYLKIDPRDWGAFKDITNAGKAQFLIIRTAQTLEKAKAKEIEVEIEEKEIQAPIITGDNLQVISGIGAIYEQKLKAAGYTTIEQIAAANEHTLAKQAKIPLNSARSAIMSAKLLEGAR